MTAGNGLDVVGASVLFGAHVGLRDVDLRVGRGERLALLGPSGTGKTSLLRAVAGLGGWSDGRVLVDGRDVTTAAPHRRGVVYMHQAPTLFPHLSVIDNVAFPLEVRGLPRHEAHVRATTLLDRVQLGPLARRAPATLSGGQRHRVALARALAANPAVLLLDEPFSSLDPELRTEVRQAVIDVLEHDAGPAVIIVTHDIDEATMLADRVAVLLQGRVAQCGTPTDLLTAPSSVGVARFLGLPNLLTGVRDDRGTIRCALGTIDAPGPAGPVAVTVHASAVSVRAPQPNGTSGLVSDVRYGVTSSLVQVDVEGVQIVGTAEAGLTFQRGDTVGVLVVPRAFHVMALPPADTSRS